MQEDLFTNHRTNHRHKILKAVYISNITFKLKYYKKDGSRSTRPASIISFSEMGK